MYIKCKKNEIFYTVSFIILIFSYLDKGFQGLLKIINHWLVCFSDI